MKLQAHSRYLQETASARTFNGFGPVKKSSEIVHVSIKTKSKHQVTYLKIQIISKC